MTLRHTLRAFTLLELLIVSTLMAVLISLMSVGLVRGKQATQRISCVNNLKHWGHATHLYATDNEDKLPLEAAQDGINTWEMTGVPSSREVWYNALASTLGVTSVAQYSQTPSSQQGFYSPGTLFHCPRARFSPVAATYPNFSLAMNSKLMRDFEGNLGAGSWVSSSAELKITQIKVPERTALFLDSGVPGEEKLSPFQAPYTGQPKACASQFSVRHGQMGNILFAAGHVLSLAGEAVVDMNIDSPNRGGGIYPPTDVIWRHEPDLVP